MARRRKTPPAPSPNPISIGNCEVFVEAKNFTSETDHNCVQIALSKTAKIRISVVEKVDDLGEKEHEKFGGCCFVLANPKDTDDQTKSILEEVISLYMKELPAMNYAANTGKKSTFLERCVTNGKYCTLVLKSENDKQPGEVIAAITYQIIPADTQHAEVPLAAVSSKFQLKGIGRLIYLELRKRLQSVGIRTVFCWGDKESEGFWFKQGFKVIGQVDKKGRARRLRIKADIRKALCFPGGSTLMMSELLKDGSPQSAELLPLCLPINSLELNRGNQLMHTVESHGTSTNEITKTGYSESEKVAEKVLIDGFQDVGPLPLVKYCSLANSSGGKEGGIKDDEDNRSCSVQGTKKRMWEASCTSLKSKKVKGTHSSESQLGSHCPVWTSDGRIVNCLDRNCMLTSGDNFLPYTSLSNSGSDSMHGKVEDHRPGNITNENCPAEIPDTQNCYRIMLMNIADDDKKSRLTKIIEDLGGVVTSDGSLNTHVVTGKVRKTLNFCTALCSGAWVISPGWLKESFKKGRFVEELPFILKDEDYTTKYRVELKSAVLRAKASPSALLKGLDIWLTTQVQPPATTLTAIVKSAGGNVIWTQNEIKDATKTVFIACEENMEEALSAVKLGIWTFSVDWLMNCVMRQELDLEAPQFAESL